MKRVEAAQIIQKKGGEKLVLVASRRTDMPAFYMDELVNGLNHGVFYPQPMMQAMFELIFSAGEIHSVNLWSQDFSAFINRRKEIKRAYNYYFRFTILPDDPVCKPAAPEVGEQLKQLGILCGDYPGAVSVHIDPLIYYRHAGERGWEKNFSRSSLAQIMDACAGYGTGGVSYSLLDAYGRVIRCAAGRGIELFSFDETDRARLTGPSGPAVLMKELASARGLKLFTCCEPAIAEAGMSLPGSCVDASRLNALFGPGAPEKPDYSQRRLKGCLCSPGLDIGRYIRRGPWSHRCGHECPVCYAQG